MYTGTYDDDNEEEVTGTTEVQSGVENPDSNIQVIDLHAEVYIFAQVYLIEGLNNIALLSIQRILAGKHERIRSLKAEKFVPVLKKLFCRLPDADPLLNLLTRSMAGRHSIEVGLGGVF